jgi:hypothetical protein
MGQLGIEPRALLQRVVINHNVSIRITIYQAWGYNSLLVQMPSSGRTQLELDVCFPILLLSCIVVHVCQQRSPIFMKAKILNGRVFPAFWTTCGQPLNKRHREKQRDGQEGKEDVRIGCR